MLVTSKESVHSHNSDPNVLMMEPTEDRHRDYGANRLGAPGVRRVLAQGPVRSHFVVIDGVGLENPAQLRLARHHRVV